MQSRAVIKQGCDILYYNVKIVLKLLVSVFTVTERKKKKYYFKYLQKD